jgi:hypothetical protein
MFLKRMNDFDGRAAMTLEYARMCRYAYLRVLDSSRSTASNASSE